MRATRLPIAAFVVAVAGALVAAVAPLGQSCGTTFPGNQTTCRGTSTFSVDGWWVLVVVSVPVAILMTVAATKRDVAPAGAIT